MPPSMNQNWTAPGAEPVVSVSVDAAACNNDDIEERCAACQSSSLRTDWAQGDRVCTNCGLVTEAHVRDDRPEWKDFQEAEDLVKGLPSSSRSGLVAVDESKYLGGLQPTTLSKNAFGGESSKGGSALARVRKRLRVTNLRLDYMMEKMHSKAMEQVHLERKIRRSNPSAPVTSDPHIRPELENLVLQEETDAHRCHTVLYAQKWSLDRAILLHGSAQEQRSVAPAEEENLQEHMDATLRKASKDLYTAYYMIGQAAKALDLPDQVQREVSHRLAQFVTHRDGFRIAGIASRLGTSSSPISRQEQAQAKKQLQDFNLRKQMASLGAALIFVTARSLGWTRTVVEICKAMTNGNNRSPSMPGQSSLVPNIKPKHVSKAIHEIKTLFPDYCRQPTQTENNQTDAHSRFVEHSLQPLKLPPVAEATIRFLLEKCREEQVQHGSFGSTKLATLCAAITYMVCSTGSIMQKLAQQHQESMAAKRSLPNGSTWSSRKRRRFQPPTTISIPSDVPSNVEITESDDNFDSDTKKSSLKQAPKDNVTSVPFDVFSDAALEETAAEKREYELKRMWDAWAEQMSWHRTASQIEQSCGVTRSATLQFYQSDLYPRRLELLESLVHAIEGTQTPLPVAASSATSTYNATVSSIPLYAQMLKETPLAPILLGQVTTAAPLMQTGSSSKLM
eukprot:Nitzschia sp. Nitz4//scaffold126_size65214//45593//47623//NITZ4_006161-RA/size65214-processed-gene-0.92-mRNA-1//-1//CDS//3329534704//1330//frame0